MSECPECSGRSHVKDTRSSPDGLRRRRECVECGHRWTTIEITHNTFRSARKAVKAMTLANKKLAEPEKRDVPDALWKLIDRNRGFSVPDRLKDEYRGLRRKGLSAQEAAEALGIK